MSGLFHRHYSNGLEYLGVAVRILTIGILGLVALKYTGTSLEGMTVLGEPYLKVYLTCIAVGVGVAMSFGVFSAVTRVVALIFGGVMELVYWRRRQSPEFKARMHDGHGGPGKKDGHGPHDHGHRDEHSPRPPDPHGDGKH